MNNNKLNKVLLYIIAGLVLIIIAGSVFGFIKKSNNTPEVLISKGKAENLVAPVNTDDVAYFELGRIRIIPETTQNTLSKDEKSVSDENETDSVNTVMIISPWLAYPAGDTVFYEEIARKQGVIKSIFTSYFSMRTRDQILSETEEKIIEVLMEEINEKLSLGKISNIYYTDYLFLE